ncbi:MAG: hypothetical protein IPK16_02170 [Anaerolineales bacterium]|nr:hypothetical protein [Anaerolineales bacterium]
MKLKTEPEALAKQRQMRAARANGAKVLLGILIGGMIVIFGASYWASRTASGQTGLAIFLLFAAALFASVFFLNNWWQWRVLQFFDVHCPHCDQPLAVETHWTRRPSYDCPHCAKPALATARELAECGS